MRIHEIARATALALGLFYPAVANAVELAPVETFVARVEELADERFPSKGASADEARVLIIEWTDYTCLPCEALSKEAARVMAADQEVRMVIRNAPMVTRAHDESKRLALAMRAAHLQGKFAALEEEIWDLRPPQWRSDRAIRAAAERAGLDLDRFEADRHDQGLLNLMRHEVNEVTYNQLGIERAPTIFVWSKATGRAVVQVGYKKPGDLERLIRSVER